MNLSGCSANQFYSNSHVGSDSSFLDENQETLFPVSIDQESVEIKVTKQTTIHLNSCECEKMISGGNAKEDEFEEGIYADSKMGADSRLHSYFYVPKTVPSDKEKINNCFTANINKK